jgi:cell division protein FtsI/penicillin-binding protein 2
MNPTHKSRRIWGIVVLFSLGFMTLAAKLVFLQAIQRPQPPERDSSTTHRVVLTPARRGSILDINMFPMVASQFVVTVRADPIKIGIFAPELAQISAPLLGLDAPEILRRLQPETFRQTLTNWVTNGTARIPTVVIKDRVRHDNGIVTNMPVDRWTQLEALIATNRFRPEWNLSLAYTNAVKAGIAARKSVPWWNLPARMKTAKQIRQQLRPMQLDLAVLRSNVAECRAAGLYAEMFEMRSYPLEHRGSHFLGYTTNSWEPAPLGGRIPVRVIGAAGIEQRFDRELRGSNGLIETRRAAGRELVPLREREIAPTDGLNVVLTVDATIQSMVEDALDYGMETLRPKGLTAVVVRPKTGEILALANRPTWNPNSRRIPSLEALKNRALVEPAEPGSTFKIVTYAAALDTGSLKLDTMINCEGGRWNVPGTRRYIADDQGHHLHTVTAEDAFAFSSNVGAVKIGLGVGTNVLLRYIRDFGFTTRTGIECAEMGNTWRVVSGVPTEVPIHGENRGTIPRWDGMTASSLPFGYGIYATPIQTVMAAAAIANDGILMEPRMVRRIVRNDNKVVADFPPRQVRRVVQSSTARDMVQAMRRVVTAGTGGKAEILEFQVAGKTGTTKKVDPSTGKYSLAHFYASFVGFFPADDPEVCILITADEPTTAGKSYYGGKACAPLFARMGREMASYMALQPRPGTNTADALPILPSSGTPVGRGLHGLHAVASKP